jgi:hypothetical protein
VWLARLKRPADAEIPRDSRLGHPADQVDERRRQQRGLAIVDERELHPAEQQRERERLVRLLNIAPTGRNAVRERRGGDLGWFPSPVPAMRLHQQHRRQFVPGDPERPALDRVPVAVSLPGAIARVALGRVVHRGANLDDRLHPPYGHVRLGCLAGELIDLALKRVTRARAPPARAKPYRATHRPHRGTDL